MVGHLATCAASLYALRCTAPQAVVWHCRITWWGLRFFSLLFFSWHRLRVPLPPWLRLLCRCNPCNKALYVQQQLPHS